MATLKNTVINSTSHMTLPSGTTAQRPATPQQGYIRYNTSSSTNYHGDDWFLTMDQNAFVRTDLGTQIHYGG